MGDCSRCDRPGLGETEAYIPGDDEVSWTPDPLIERVEQRRDYDWWCGRCWMERNDGG